MHSASALEEALEGGLAEILHHTSPALNEIRSYIGQCSRQGADASFQSLLGFFHAGPRILNNLEQLRHSSVELGRREFGCLF